MKSLLGFIQEFIVNSNDKINYGLEPRFLLKIFSFLKSLTNNILCASFSTFYVNAIKGITRRFFALLVAFYSVVIISGCAGPAIHKQEQVTLDSTKLDLLVFMNRSAIRELELISDIKGVRKIINAKDWADGRLTSCIFSKNPITLAGTSEEALLDATNSKLGQYLASLGNVNFFTLRNQIADGSYYGLVTNAEPQEYRTNTILNTLKAECHGVLSVQREALAELAHLSYFQQQFEKIHELPFETIIAELETIRERAAQQRKMVDDRANELERLAKNGSNEKIASLAFGTPWFQSITPFCTVRYDEEDAAAIRAYALRGHATQSDNFRSIAERRGVRLKKDPLFAEVYNSVAELYEAIQRQKTSCLIYVDYPSNIKKIADAVLRDYKVSYTINEFLSSANLRDEWAAYVGYRNFAELQAAQQMQVDKREFNNLVELGISNKSSLDAVVREMRSTGYSNGSAIVEVIAYLRDKSEAAKMPGLTALSVKESRLMVAKEAEAARAINQRRQREELAKEYPYIAVMTCGLPGHINIFACFTGGRGGVETELKIRNGSNSSMIYKAFNLMQVGQQQQDGFYINLRRNFNIQAQNSHDRLILGIKIIDRLSGLVLYENQAGMFGVLSAKN